MSLDHVQPVGSDSSGYKAGYPNFYPREWLAWTMGCTENGSLLTMLHIEP